MSADIEDRFECILEPFDTWMVFDRQDELPAMLGDQLLMSLSEMEAVDACQVLNHANRCQWSEISIDMSIQKTAYR